MGDWYYAGEASVTSQGKIRLPERVFEAGILDPRKVAYWAYEDIQGFVLISDDPLTEKERYKPQDSTPIGDKEKGYLTNIPKVFFEDYEGRGRGPDKSPLPKKARVKYGEKRFFAYREGMASEENEKPNSCYIFNWEQFDNTIGDDDWAESLSEIPRLS